MRNALPLWGGCFLLACATGLAFGSAEIGWAHLFSPASSDADTLLSKAVFWQIRFPRVLTAAAVGAGLAIVGATLQTMLRNPLADPFLLGVSSSAATGAALALALGWNDLRFAFSVVFALLGLLFLDRIAYRNGTFSDHHLLISGFALTYLLSAVTGLVIALADSQKTRGLLFWLMGGFADLDPTATVLSVLALAVISGLLWSRSNDLDLLASGDESAHILGLRPHRFRRYLFFLCSVMVGVAVATAGGIGFVGVVIPHLARLFCGVSHRHLLTLSLLGGATLTLLADTLARTIISPREIPVGLITAVLGAPYFLYHLNRGR